MRYVRTLSVLLLLLVAFIVVSRPGKHYITDEPQWVEAVMGLDENGNTYCAGTLKNVDGVWVTEYQDAWGRVYVKKWTNVHAAVCHLRMPGPERSVRNVYARWFIP